jgi:DNA repair protein RadC
MSGNGKTQAPSEPEDTAPHYHGHRERLRQRFRDAGSEAVTDYELLELASLDRRRPQPLAIAADSA